uniref:Uncharacterized protein n=1 Tax=Leersia perrieri TaxID=77586 RepID=A0A0D9X7W2_9ORYZ
MAAVGAATATLRRRVALTAADAVIYLWYAILWVSIASVFVVVAARRTWGEGSALLAAARGAAQGAILLALPLTVFALPLYAVRSVCPYNADDTKEKYIKILVPESPRRSTVGVMVSQVLEDKVILGGILCMPFFFFMLVGSLMKGSQSERIGSMLTDAGCLGACLIYCFVISPASILKVRRMR